LEVIARFKEVIREGGQVALAMPRGTGKSVMAQFIALWALLYCHLRFLVIVAANKKEAKKMLDAIKDAISTNRLLLEDFPEIVYPLKRLNGSALLARGQLYFGKSTAITWTAEDVIFPTILGSKASGAKVVCVGINGAIRGKNTEMPDGSTARPDLVIIDDPQTEDTAASPKKTEKIEEKIAKAIKGLAEAGTRLSQIMTVTVIREGDAADRYLDHNIYPQWHGMRYKMLDAFPENTALWDEYATLRRVSEKQATAFYKKNRAAMDKGAVCTWDDCFDRRSEISAIQAAMNLHIDDPVSFSSEQQNEPIRPETGSSITDAKTIRKRLNGLKRGVVPSETEVITGFIDVHDNVLYWCVAAWAGDFTGYVIDYGTFPEQSRSYFNKNDRDLHVMKERFKGRKNTVIAQGVEFLATDLLRRLWTVQNDETAIMQIDRLLIDSRYMHKAVESALTRIRDTSVKPSMGIGVPAKTTPMNQWPQRTGRKYGDYWFIDKPSRRSYRTVTMDVNYWKCQVHDAFGLKAGDRGGLTLWGKSGETHRMFSEHCNGETVQFVSAKYQANEWTTKPNMDNHLFDCMVGCMAAASYAGIKANDMPAPLIQTSNQTITKQARMAVRFD